jgi:hypothetical protein
VTSTLRALPFVLVATAGCTSVHAQQLTCYPIRSGESASGIARRLTGDHRNFHQPWFHVVEPTTGRIISKRRYEHIQAGWHVCLGSMPSGDVWLRSAYLPVAATPGALLQAVPTQRVSWSERTLLWWAAPLVLLPAAMAGWIFAARRRDEWRATAVVMRGFGKRFVNEFERPLFRRHTRDPVIHSRLRVAARRCRLDILVAPSAGRSYPNLADHRNNVEYDVERILAQLGDRQFVHGPLYAEGDWVVIPFRFSNVTNRRMDRDYFAS